LTITRSGNFAQLYGHHFWLFPIPNNESKLVSEALSDLVNQLWDSFAGNRHMQYVTTPNSRNPNRTRLSTTDSGQLPGNQPNSITNKNTPVLQSSGTEPVLISTPSLMSARLQMSTQQVEDALVSQDSKQLIDNTATISKEKIFAEVDAIQALQNQLFQTNSVTQPTVTLTSTTSSCYTEHQWTQQT